MIASEQELADAIRDARGALQIAGGGTRGLTGTGASLSVAGLSGIERYEPGALTLVARAGTPLADIEAGLATNNQRLAFEPTDLRSLMGTGGTPTIGGVVACNASGPRRIQAGACRDSLLGVRFVDGRGDIIKNGGRVMKNVTGYDLVKLMAGSFGTLGVLTEVSFKVLPIPEATATLTFQGLEENRAIDALCAAMGSPFDVTGAAHSRSDAATFLRVEGFAGSVEERSKKLAAELSQFGAAHIETDPQRNASVWKDMRDVTAFSARAGDVWRISVKPTDGPRVAAMLDAQDVLYDWGGGLVWALMPAGTDIRPALSEFKGHATLVRRGATTPATLPTFHPEPALIAKISAKLRAQFDPRGILNPGIMT